MTSVKVGMIFECGPEGADKQVCEHLATLIRPDIQIEGVTLTNKQRLISECGQAAATLLASGCERVLIFWDLWPPWGGRQSRPCRKNDRQRIWEALVAAHVAQATTHVGPI